MIELFRDKTRNKPAIVAGLVFLTITCLYRWTNLMFNHDSLMVVRDDFDWQTSLGRFLNVVYLSLRREVMPPLIVGLFGGFFLIVAVILHIHTLGVKRRSSVILGAGLLVTFETIAYVNASFALSFEIDMLALLYASFAAWLLTRAKSRLRFPFAVLFIFCSLAHFQSYVEVTIVLVMLALYRDLLEGKKPADVLRAGVGAVLTLLVAGLCYYVAVRVIWNATGYGPKNTYNSLINIGKITDSSPLDLLARTWLFFFNYLAAPFTTNSRLVGAIHLLFGAYIIAQTAVLTRKRRLEGKTVALLLLLIVLFPLGCNCVFFLSNGMKHSLMTYSFVFFDVWALMLFDVAREDEEPRKESFVSDAAFVSESKEWLKRHALLVLCAILILNRILFANALYLKVDLLTRATLSFMTRMVDRMEQTPGYKIGETPVLILGHLDQNPCAQPLVKFWMLNDDLLKLKGLSITYPETYQYYFAYILNYPVQFVLREEMTEYLEKLDPEAVQNMPVFPEQGGVALIDGVLVVRLSENIDVTEDVDW